MPYPRQLELGEEVEKELVEFTDRELVNHLAERGDFDDEIQRNQRDYAAKPASEETTIPFKGASQIIIPLTAITTEAVHARTQMQLYAVDQFISAKLVPEHEALNRELEVFLDATLLSDMDWRFKTEAATLELEKHGTGILHPSYKDLTRMGIRTNEEGKEEEFEVVLERGPCIESIPIANFLMPFDATDPQRARWVGHWFELTPFEVKLYEDNGFFKEGTYEELSTYYTFSDENGDSDTNIRQNQEELEDREPVWPARLKFYMLFTDWDVDNSGQPKAITYVFHKDSCKIYACWYNWHRDLRRPYRHSNYFPVEHRWAGIGICQQSYQFQLEVTTIHRQRLDNATIANMRMFKVKKDRNIQADEPLYPGKFFFVEEMDEIEPIQSGDVYASDYNNENQAVIYSQQRSGVNELTLGMPQVGTPGTATDSAARVQESARKFDYTLSNIKRMHLLAVEDTLCNIVQWGPNVDRLQFSPKGAELEMLFKRPFDLFRKRLLLSLDIVGANQNRYIDQQKWTQVSGLMTSYFTQLQQLAEGTQNQELLAQIAAKAPEAATEVMRQILETFEIRNPERILLELQNVTRPLGASAPPQLPAGSGPSAPALGPTTPVVDPGANQLSLLGPY